jgi:hypothetical protein
MDKYQLITKDVDTFDIESEIKSVSLSSLVSFEEVLVYLRRSRAASAFLVMSGATVFGDLFRNKAYSSKKGFLDGFNAGYDKALRLFKEAKRYSWSNEFTIETFENYYKEFSFKYEDAKRNNTSDRNTSVYKEYYYRSFLSALIDSWVIFTGKKSRIS